MKFIKILIFSILTSIHLSAQVAKECLVYEHVYKFGSPAENGILIEHRYYDKNEYLIKCQTFNGISSPRNYLEYKNDEHGKVVQKTEFSKGGRLLGSTQYTYHESGAELSEKEYDMKGTLVRKIVNVYSEDKNYETESYTYNKTGLNRKTVNTEVDTKGRRTAATVFFPNGQIEFLIKISEHDAFGNEQVKAFYNAKGKYLYSYNREWNADNQLISKHLEGQYKISYVYDSNKRLENEIHYNVFTYEPIKLIRYVYIF